MRHRFDTVPSTVPSKRNRFRRRAAAGAVAVASLALLLAAPAAAQEPGLLPALEPGELAEGPPVTQMGGGSFFSQDLGALLRVRYSTESYGQNQRGNLDIGTMQVFNYEDAIAFFDGQITLNDVQGTGFNVGLGWRWLDSAFFPWDPERIFGVSVWADGTSTEAGNFFPQIGVSYESLGELWDFRANGYTPLGHKEQIGDFSPTGEIGFQDNFLSELTQATVDTAFNVGEIEVARRLAPDRDAWVFAGGYALVDTTQDAGGYRVGLRGYAYPDLMLQFALSDDDIFRTNATFSLTWFVGRTRSDYRPTCGILDRFREPVLRNDYVAIAQSTTIGGIPLTDTDGAAIRFVHVNSSAAPGGDGSFEDPLNNLDDIDNNSQPGDIVLAWSESIFTGQEALLQNDQRFLGEGNGFEHQVTTAEQGTFTIPETSPGARSRTRPVIQDSGGDAVTLADLNEVANFTITGGTRGIAAGASGAGNPNLHDLAISGTSGNAIELTPFDFIDTDDEDNDNNTTETLIHGNVTIDNLTLDDVGGNGVDITATDVDVTQPNVQLQEVISLTDITSTDGNGRAIAVRNTHSGTGRTTTVNNFIYNGGTTSAGAIQLENFDGTFTASNSTLTNGATTGEGVQILGDSDGSITFQNTVTFNNLDGTAFEIDGDSAGANEFGGTVTVQSAITNDTGLSVSLQGVGAGTVTFNGDITDTGDGIRANSNSGGVILFVGDTTLTTEDSDAILLTDNDGSDINFTGVVDITTTGGDAFVATGGGTLTASGTTNTISTTTGRIAQIEDMTISATGVNFSEASRSASANTEAILLSDNTGGPILIGTVGDDAGESGTIVGGTVNAIEINNSANVTVSGLEITNTAAVSGVLVNKSTTGTQTVNLNDLNITGGSIGVDVESNGTGTLNMTVNDTNVLSSTVTGMLFNGVDAGTIQVNNTTIDGNATAAQGVVINDSNASFTFDAESEVREFGGTAFQVNGGTGTVSFQGDLLNTANRSVHVLNKTGGSVTFTATSTITDSGTGMVVEDNTGGTYSFLGTNEFDPVAAAVQAIFVDNNDGATITFSGLNINTADESSTRGFVAQGGGTLSVSGSTNVINTENGSGLVIDGMTIGSVDFQSVTVDGATGPLNAIVLQDLTGGQVAIGTTTGAQNSGGVLRSTGDTIILEDAQNVDLRQMQIVASGAGSAVNIDHTAAATTTMDVTIDGLNLDATTGDGISVVGASGNEFDLRLTDGDLENNVVIDITGAGAFGLLVDNNDLTTTGTEVAFSLDFSGSAQDGDVTIRNGNAFTAADATVLAMTVNGTNADIEFSLDNNTLTNNSGTEQTADVLVNGGATLNANVVNNTITNSGAADEFAMTSDGSNTRINLNLDNNGPPGSDYELTTVNQGVPGVDFNFGVVDRDNTDANNPGNVNFNPVITDFEDITGPVESPTVP